MKPAVQLIALCALLGAASVAAQSTSSGGQAGGQHGHGLRAGAFRVYPTLGVTLGYDSNVVLAADQEIESFFSQASPNVRIETGRETNLIGLDLNAEAGWYSQSGRDNYTEYGGRITWLYNPLIRHTLAMDAGMHWAHDRRGTAGREGDLALLDLDPDRYRLDDIGGKYTFGAPGAKARIEADAHFRDRTYLNNRALTRGRDLTESNYGGAFYWRIFPKTSAVVRAEQGQIKYDVANLDSTEQHYFVGLDLDATAKLAGTAMVGAVRKRFDDPTNVGYSGLSWRVGLTYKWRTYSSFNVSTTSETDETNGTGDFILRRDVTFGWTHNWSERVSTALDAGTANEEHRPATRQDHTTFVGVSADYLFRPWLRAGASYRTVNRSSDFSQFDYSHDLLLISLEAAL